MREKKETTGTGKAAKKKKRASYWESLSFLNNVEDERKGLTNAGETENTEVAMENEDLVTSDPVDATETVENISDCGNYEEHGQGEEDDLGGTGPLTSPAQFERKSGRNLRKKDKKHELIVDLLQHRKEEKNKLVKCVEKMIDMEEKYSKENENDLFFKSMAAIVNKLDKKSQAIARSQVFRVVSDLELAQYTAPSSVSTTPSASSLDTSWTPAPASFENDQSRDSTSQQYVWMDKFIQLK
ncbi:hypothetical protein J6590_014493 [Homalodisca vitripennis]|nr:hypothetical protein J6590_014493 [Homalodisca vitripennis]